MATSKLVFHTDTPAERALFEGKLHGMVVTCFANERPLQGLAGALDWRFEGLLSQSVRWGSTTGALGECVYLPVRRKERTFHLVLVGCGHSAGGGQRSEIPNEALEALLANLEKLKVGPLGISQKDFGDMNKDYFQKNFKGAPVWIVQ